MKLLNEEQLNDLFHTITLADTQANIVSCIERDLILHLMGKYGGCQRAVSRVLKLPKSTLNDRLSRYKAEDVSGSL